MAVTFAERTRINNKQPEQMSYHEQTEISNSDLSLLQNCGGSLQKWIHEKKNRKETDAMRVGSLLHCMVLEPKEVEARFAREPKCDKRTKEGKVLAAEFAELSAGKTVVSSDEWSDCEGMASAIRSHPSFFIYFEGASVTYEEAFIWQHESGAMCRSKMDCVKRLNESGNVFIVDIKSTEDATERAVLRTIMKYGYHRQAAFYADAIRANEKVNNVHFVFCFVEKKAPYFAEFYYMDTDFVQKGRAEYEALLAKLSDAKANNTFTDDKSTKVLTAPFWEK